MLLSGAPGLSQAGASLTELTAQVDAIAGQVKNSDDNLKVVETQYSERPAPTDSEARLRRFSDGEIQYLLGDYRGASVLFYDLVADARFKSNERYLDAVFYLADSLFRQKSYVGAKMYLREVMSGRGAHYKEALARYLEVAGHLNEFTGIDEYIGRAKDLSGELPPEIAYVYGKWLFKRTDLPLDERVKRAQAVFTPLAAGGGQYRLQSAFFLAVAQVKLKAFDAAIAQFERISAQRAQGEREAKVIELSNLSLGRLLYETGKYDRAVDRYQEIPRESEFFVDALYETAWAQVKKGEYERAKNATDILLLVAPDSTLAPEAQILQGHLLLKLHRYVEATDTYNLVINSYAPVRDEIDALLTVNKDPVRYFDDLLAKNERNLDVNSLLPPVALKWATTQREVADAVQMVNDLESGRRGVQESEEIAQHILKAIDERGLETFPALQEGYTRADVIDSALTQAEQSLLTVEGHLLVDYLSPEGKAAFEKAKAEQAALQVKFDQLPTTDKQSAARKQRIKDQIDELDKAAFKLGYEVQSMYAVVAAVEKWLQDTKSQRQNTPEDERAFTEKLRHEVEVLASLQKDTEKLRQALSDERGKAEASIGGEEIIRQQLEAELAKQHQLISEAEGKVPAEAQAVLQKAHDLRAYSGKIRIRVTEAKRKLRAQVTGRGTLIRETVNSERAVLANYGKEVAQVSGNARDMVGRIAFDSFKRVRGQFYDLVLKADVGVIDVAFTRKQDKTAQIQKLASQKDRELRALDEEFKEVLKDVD
ncbi:MAG: tetratricopeptide repeat protein [Myxococcaceae bacterium]